MNESKQHAEPRQSRRQTEQGDEYGAANESKWAARDEVKEEREVEVLVRRAGREGKGSQLKGGRLLF